MAKAHAIGPQPVPQIPKPKHINCYHTKAGGPDVTPDPHVLHISANDQAEWASTEELAFTVEFESGSPFKATVFHVPAGGVVISGPITGKPDTYKYSLVNHLGVVKDPTIIIQE